MVQATEEVISHSDLPQALMLLSEMNVSAQHVASLVDNMIQRVRRGEFTTHQGLSFLEMKYNMLLSYLINLTYVVLRKCSGEKIEGDPCIDRLIEIRTILDKVRPIDHKLKYQIDKLVKTAAGTNACDPASFKANPENLLGNSDNSEGESDISESTAKEKLKEAVYVPPKLSALHYTDETTRERNKRAQERSKRLTLSSSLLEDLREEYLDIPLEVSQSSRGQQIISKQQSERQEYEEEYLTRLPVTKAEKHTRKHLTTLGTLGEEITSFANTSMGSKKRKKSFRSKSKKNFKKKRLH